MMKQRRRMLLSGGIDLTEAFSSADYVASGGFDGKNSGSIYAQIDSSLINYYKRYYVFAYFLDQLTILRLYNGSSKVLYDSRTYYSMSIRKVDPYYRLYIGYYPATKNSMGFTVLDFKIGMDGVFSNFQDSKGFGQNALVDDSRYGTYSDVLEEGVTRYLFAGVAENFCIYKSSGLLYSDLVPLFQHNLSLMKSSSSQFKIGNTSSNGYTLVSVKE